MKHFTFLMIMSFSMSSIAGLRGEISKFEFHATKADASCKTDKQDVYELGRRITHASFKYGGLCLDTNRMRPPKLQSRTGTHAVISNFQHKGQYWLAKIPLSEDVIKSMEVMILSAKFKPGIVGGHSQMRIYMNQPVRLVSQKDPRLTDEVNEIVYSIEAIFPHKVTYSALTGLVPNYPVIARMVSEQQRASEEANYHYPTYPLHFEKGEKSLILQMMVARADQLQATYFYNTAKRACTTELFILFDKLPRLKGRFRPFHLKLSTDPAMGPMTKALIKRGLIRAEEVH